MSNDSQSRHWIELCAEREKQRRKEAASFRELAESVRAELSEHLNYDLHRYRRSFPAESEYIKITNEPGRTVIARSGYEGGIYDALRPVVVFNFEHHPGIALECSFEHRPALNRRFNVVIDEKGRPRFENASVSNISEYLLKPVLFDKLSDD